MFRFSTGRQTKDVPIPDRVPLGAVIGKDGSNCKSIYEKHGVRCSVNQCNRKVRLTGLRSCIEHAEDDLATLFSSVVTINSRPNRVFEVVVRDGPTHLWAFRKDKEESSEVETKDYRYRLQQCGRAVETASAKNAWIKEFCEYDTANVMGYLVKTRSDSPVKIRVSFGKLCFRILSDRCKNPIISWTELQKLEQYDDFVTRWSNYCNWTSPAIATLMDDLDEWMEKNGRMQEVLVVHVLKKKGVAFTLKYHLIDGQWKLHKAYKKRYVHGSYDVIVNNDISFRLRAVTRERMLEKDAVDIQRYLRISTPDTSDFFGTKVSLNAIAPEEMHITSFVTVSRVHVNMNGLRFVISHLDQLQKEYRLECGLLASEKGKLDENDNEAQVLLKKVLQMLS